jgi:glycosyltransferase involved in cell wall biosynthesis
MTTAQVKLGFMNISVVIPTYNRCDLLRRALLSVFSQTLLPAEVIVIDDGSSDDTAKLIQTEFSEVRYYHQENCGVSSARNLGIQHATGDWIAFLDSDDEWLPEKLARQIAALNANPESTICHTEEQWIRNGVRVNPAKQYAKPGGWIFTQCLPLCAISPSTVLIHRSVFDDVGYFDTNLPACEDYDLWLRITANYPVLLIEEPQIKKHGGHQDQLSQKHWGMDRFRINALQKIIASGQLSSEYQQAAIGMLLKKAEIYLNGLTKRGKMDEVGYYQELIERHSGV